MSKKCASRVEIQCLRAEHARQTPKVSDVVGSTAKASEKHGYRELST
ncbi:hypothetical protein DSM25558_0189 [Agrobacterium sp. DSM 25558]|nr:hypothetical protein DSM25558_0189 [Agrobacterium sp. DSM 25558]